MILLATDSHCLTLTFFINRRLTQTDAYLIAGRLGRQKTRQSLRDIF